MKQSVPKNTFLLIISIATIFGFLFFLRTNSLKIPTSTSSSTENQNLEVNTYTSQDLKISFNYPKNWIVEEEDRLILVSNFKSNLHKNTQLSNSQIEITFDEFANCFSSLEEDIIKPACGQGKTRNKIISKEVKESLRGNFIKFSLESPDKNQQIQYFFQKDKNTLGISKNPDPSQFEKEFEDLVNSIRFLD